MGILEHFVNVRFVQTFTNSQLPIPQKKKPHVNPQQRLTLIIGSSCWFSTLTGCMCQRTVTNFYTTTTSSNLCATFLRPSNIFLNIPSQQKHCKSWHITSSILRPCHFYFGISCNPWKRRKLIGYLVSSRERHRLEIQSEK